MMNIDYGPSIIKFEIEDSDRKQITYRGTIHIPIGPTVLSVEFALFQRGHAVDGFVVFGAGDDTPAFVE